MEGKTAEPLGGLDAFGDGVEVYAMHASRCAEVVGLVGYVSSGSDKKADLQ